MKFSIDLLLKGTFWTVGAFGVSSLIRLLSNVILARLLSPQVFGLMLIVSTIRTGIELFTDLGIGQNIIHSKDANKVEFYTTAWTLQLVRSVMIWILFLALCIPMSRFYGKPELAVLLPVAGFGIIITGLNSISFSLLQKRLMIYKVNVFEIITQIISTSILIALVYFYRSIWSLVVGTLLGSVVYAIGSHFLILNLVRKINISRTYFWDIIHFGKWIFLSSIVYFLALNADRLYLAKAVPLQALGIYGISRSMSDLVVNLLGRIGNNVLFPFISAHSMTQRSELRAQLTSLRAKFFVLVAVGMSAIVVASDLAVKFLYDARYRDATWILPVLIIGSWFSVLANVNDSTLLGLGKPAYGAISNTVKFVFLIVFLPIGVKLYGLVGGVFVIALCDVPRYVPIFIGQRRERFSFATQDISITILMFGLIALFEVLRLKFGFGTSFDSLPAFGLGSSPGS